MNALTVALAAKMASIEHPIETVHTLRALETEAGMERAFVEAQVEPAVRLMYTWLYADPRTPEDAPDFEEVVTVAARNIKDALWAA